MNRRALLIVAMVLSACVPASESDTASRAVITETTLPPMKTFAARAPARPQMANPDLARDFMELSFQMESGRQLPVFTRFEGPVSVRVTGDPPASLRKDLGLLLSRLRREAGIDIRQTRGTSANITIEAVPRSAIRKVLPQAACFVAPNVASLQEFRGARRGPRTNWTRLETRQQLAIFIPNDTSPQEVRDCLHEELAQALGPLNDLYRLPNSVFNDDNVHTVLTGFDMMILRITYAPELSSGMRYEDVAYLLPDILTRLNPAGQRQAQYADSPTPQAFSDAIQTALGPGASASARRAASDRAIRIAIENGWTGPRRGFAHYAKARLLQSTDPAAAYVQYRMADQFYARSPDTRLHRAYVATQLAAYALSNDDPQAARRIAAAHVPAARESENAALLATLLLLQSEALEMEGHAAEARALRLDSLGWARYGFGADWAVRAKLREIAALRPAPPPV